VRVTTFSRNASAHITLQYAADVPARWRAGLDWAASVWEGVIGGSLPVMELASNGGDCPTPDGEPVSPAQSGTETGVRIYVGQSGRYPPGTYVEATGGPCVQRALPFPTTIIGAISLNRDKPVSAIDDIRLAYLAIHEMGHVLGLVAGVQRASPDWYDVATGSYSGAMGLEGWRRNFGDSRASLHFDHGAHWDSPPLFDIMSASGGGAGVIGPITRVSVGAWIDLGYSTTLDAAVAFDSVPHFPQ